MSAAVGAALKKILAAILTEPKVLKKVLFAILVVVVAMMMPTVFVLSLFSGNFQVDTAALQGYVEENLSDADVQFLSGVEDTMEAIEKRVAKAASEMEFAEGKFDYVLINDNLEKALAEAENVIGNFLDA